MNKPIFIVDFDCCLVDSISAFCETKDLFSCLAGNTNPLDVNRYNFSDIYPTITPKEIQDIFASYTFFDKLKFMPNAKSVLEKLSQKFRLMIVSIGTLQNISHKSIWIADNLPFIDDVILIKNNGNKMNKSIINTDNVFAFLDDHEGNLFSTALPQQYCYCYGETKSWNENWTGNRLRNWNEVEKEFLR